MKAIEMETVIVLYQDEQSSSPKNESNPLMELAGRIKSFREIDDPIAYQKTIRDEWARG